MMKAAGGSDSDIRIACIQMRPVVGEKARNIAASCSFIETAASQGARLIVLPELCTFGPKKLCR